MGRGFDKVLGFQEGSRGVWEPLGGAPRGGSKGSQEPTSTQSRAVAGKPLMAWRTALV